MEQQKYFGGDKHLSVKQRLLTPELKRALLEHKLMTRDIADNNMIIPSRIEKQRLLGQMIALALANFKCEENGCNETIKLTYHHLISTKNEKVIPYHKYISQRQYFFNIAILCLKSHAKIDPEIMTINSPTFISEESIKDIKNAFKMA